MNLYFMRHGIAVERADSRHRSDDRSRQLTPKGIKRINKAAKGLVTLSLSFNRILTSPFERARETAKIGLTARTDRQLSRGEFPWSLPRIPRSVAHAHTGSPVALPLPPEKAARRPPRRSPGRARHPCAARYRHSRALPE